MGLYVEGATFDTPQLCCGVVHLLDALLDQQLIGFLLREDGYKLFRGVKQLLRLVRLEVVMMSLAEGQVAFCEGF